jgi:hypothetical protein
MHRIGLLRASDVRLETGKLKHYSLSLNSIATCGNTSLQCYSFNFNNLIFHLSSFLSMSFLVAFLPFE